MKSWLQHYFEPLVIADSKQNIPCLDGLRSTAILLVIFNHCSGKIANLNLGGNLWERVGHASWVGVDLFFVLSGFLIGSQLLNELNKTGTIKIGRFFIKRTLRLWPLYYFILFLIVAYQYIFKQSWVVGWHDILYWMNYREAIVPGGWSLATEEQFYILAPLGLVLIFKFKNPLSLLRMISIVAVLLSPMMRAWVAHSLGINSTADKLYVMGIYEPIHTHFDSLVIGIFISTLPLTKKVGGYLRSYVWVLFALLLGAIGATVVNPVAFKLSLVGLLCGSLVLYCLESPTSLLVKVLSWRYFYTLSRLSYGLYLVYNFFINPVLDFFYSQLGLALSGVLHLCVTIAVLAVSSLFCVVLWGVIEEPFLRLRTRILRKIDSQEMNPIVNRKVA